MPALLASYEYTEFPLPDDTFQLFFWLISSFFNVCTIYFSVSFLPFSANPYEIFFSQTSKISNIRLYFYVLISLVLIISMHSFLYFQHFILRACHSRLSMNTLNFHYQMYFSAIISDWYLHF